MLLQYCLYEPTGEIFRRPSSMYVKRTKLNQVDMWMVDLQFSTFHLLIKNIVALNIDP